MEKKGMNRRFLLVAFFSLVSACALAAEEGGAIKAVFAEVTGKVEFQRPGAKWQSAKSGDSVEKGTIVSTGFKSSATLKLDEASLFLKPLTRLTLEELLKTSGGTQTKLYLLAGRVKADVPPQAGKTNDFRVKSPTATASVRGTAFDFDGWNLIVSRGKVQYQTPTNQSRMVGAQEFAYIAPNGTVTPPTSVSTNSDLGDASQLADQASLSGFAPPPPPPAVSPDSNQKQTGTLKITAQ
jgi:hypothetical protein